jgi:hypothetical protein
MAGCTLAISHVDIGYKHDCVAKGKHEHNPKLATSFKTFPLLSLEILGLWLIKEFGQVLTLNS